MRIVAYNDKLFCEAYDKKATGIEKVEKVSGFSGVKQKNTIVPLKLVADAVLKDGTELKTGESILIDETVLYGKPWSANVFTIEGTEIKCIQVDLVNVVGFLRLEGGDARPVKKGS